MRINFDDVQTRLPSQPEFTDITEELVIDITSQIINIIFPQSRIDDFLAGKARNKLRLTSEEVVELARRYLEVYDYENFKIEEYKEFTIIQPLARCGCKSVGKCGPSRRCQCRTLNRKCWAGCHKGTGSDGCQREIPAVTSTANEINREPSW